MSRLSKFTLAVSALLGFAVMTSAQTAPPPAPSQSLPLWAAGKVPLAKGTAPEDTPKIDVYLPASNPTHTGVLVCPGGGYTHLAMGHEGADIAHWLNQHGIAAFVLQYRLAPYKYPAEIMDGMRAMRLIRTRADEFHIASDHIGVWGFSAGGHLAASIMTHYNERLPGIDGLPEDMIDAENAKPNFGILAYGVLSMQPEIAHMGSHNNLLGNPADPKMEALFSNELHVQPDGPPVFLFSTSDDATVPVANTVRFYMACVDKHIPVEMHVFEHGRHGLGLAPGAPGAEAWPQLLATWMQIHGWIATTTNQHSAS